MKKRVQVTFEKQSKKKIKNTCKLIRNYHTLIKKLKQIEKNESNSILESCVGSCDSSKSNESKNQVFELHSQLKELGGLEKYQQASLQASKLKLGITPTAKWILPILKMHFKTKPIRLLDVGALTGETYSKYHSWIHVTSIDINPQSPLVKKQDFFLMEVPLQPFDVLCLSLVLNYVETDHLRGEMLRRASLFLKQGGILYLVLPLPYFYAK